MTKFLCCFLLISSGSIVVLAQAKVEKVNHTERGKGALKVVIPNAKHLVNVDYPQGYKCYFMKKGLDGSEQHNEV